MRARDVASARTLARRGALSGRVCGARCQMTSEKMLLIGRRLFLAGFAAPFLWLVNAFYFRRYYKHPATPPAVKQCATRSARATSSSRLRSVDVARAFLRRPPSPSPDVVASLVCFAVVQTAWIIWTIVYQTSHNSWGLLGDHLTVVVPKGD